MIHKTAVIEIQHSWIGKGTKIWHFVHIRPDSRIGKNCQIGGHVFIGKNVTIGDGVKIQNNAFICNNSVVGDEVFIGMGVIFCDARWPRAWKTERSKPPIVGYRATIGAGAIILPGVKIGAYAMVGAGTIVQYDVPARARVTNIIRRNTQTIQEGEDHV